MKRDSWPTLKTIATQLGISVTTVSREFNGKAEEYEISKRTEESFRPAHRQVTGPLKGGCYA